MRIPWLLCVLLLTGAARVHAQTTDQTQFQGPRTPQGTLRAFARALSANDLTRAASFVSGAKTPIGARDIEAAMKRNPTRYSINNLRIAENGDVATISFFFGVDDLPNKSTWVSWAVLKRGENGWAIEAQPTRALAGGTDPFSAFATLLRGQEANEEPVKLQTRGSQLLVVGNAFLSFVQNSGNKFPLQPFSVREKVLPYYPAFDGLLRPSINQKPLSFNNKLAGISLSKLQKSQTVMLYEGADGKLDFGSDGRAAVVLVAGNVRYVDEKRAQLLQWSP